ncbi:MAG: hypothetical protein U5L72_14975 [Bacteroidales bacterium]|nr:hypothetical protein [Bacteroidales bacterium]
MVEGAKVEKGKGWAYGAEFMMRKTYGKLTGMDRIHTGVDRAFSLRT